MPSSTYVSSLLFLIVNDISKDAILILLVGTQQELVWVLLNPSIDDVVVGFNVIVNVVGSGIRSSKDGCRCFFFVFVVVVFFVVFVFGFVGGDGVQGGGGGVVDGFVDGGGIVVEFVFGNIKSFEINPKLLLLHQLERLEHGVLLL